jgi:hypothetical protein
MRHGYTHFFAFLIKAYEHRDLFPHTPNNGGVLAEGTNGIDFVSITNLLRA